MNQIGLPLLSIATSAEVREEIVKALRSQQESVAIDRADSLAGEILGGFLSAWQPGALSAEQTQRFFERLVNLEMKVRPVVSADDPVPVRIDIKPQADWRDCSMWCVVSITPVPTTEERASGHLATPWSTPSARFGRTSYMHTDEIDPKMSEPLKGPIIMRGPTFAWWQAEVDVAGDEAAEMSCDVRTDFFDREPEVGQQTEPVHVTTTLLSATSRVDSEHVAGTNLTVNPGLTPEILGPDTDGGRLSHESARCQIACYLFDVVPVTNGNTLRMSVHIYNAKTGLAFDASLAVDGSVYDVGTICHAEGESWEWILTAPYPSSGPETVDLTLTPNVNLAESSVDLPEIWGSTITFKNVPRNRPIILKPLVVEHSWP